MKFNSLLPEMVVLDIKESLKFYVDLNECFSERRPNCLFLSSVIQYLEDPYQWLKVFVDSKVDFILIDRMPFSKIKKEFIQIVKMQT